MPVAKKNFQINYLKPLVCLEAAGRWFDIPYCVQAGKKSWLKHRLLQSCLYCWVPV